jgi:uncharacterized metal-binding protein YceD (DUF177 family)
VPSPTFVVKLADLERGARQLSAEIPEAWLKHALEKTDAEPLGPGTLSLELTKNGREVMVRGNAVAKVTVPCVVTLEPLTFELKPEIFLLLRPAPEKDVKRRAGAAKKEKPGPPAAEHPKKKRRKDQEDPELSMEAAAEDLYQGEEVVLDEFLREFIVLEIPPYPRRSDLPSAEESLSSRPLADPPDEKPIDPRLLPLLGLRERLRS